MTERLKYPANARVTMEPLTIKDQFKKFGIKALLGFQTVMVFGIGRKLGIFDYLYTKATKQCSEPESIADVSFSPGEIASGLGLDPYYIDGWLHMAIECGIFERDAQAPGMLKTAPHLFHLLVNRDHPFYIGNNLAGFYMVCGYQDNLVNGFKTGQFGKWDDLPRDLRLEANKMSASLGRRVIDVFEKHCREQHKVLRKGGRVLEIGCGFGVNLENWAGKYVNARFDGIDIDHDSIVAAGERFGARSKWGDRVAVAEMDAPSFAKNHRDSYDIIIVNQVLHEIPRESERRAVLDAAHSMLKAGGIAVVGEEVVPSILENPGKNVLFEVMHKWFEVILGSRFYSDAGFRALVDSTTFGSQKELVQEGGVYFWKLVRR
nr:class I SAM-dependent methyltransferase [Candidatus Sigynarchaeota archaeon]